MARQLFCHVLVEQIALIRHRIIAAFHTYVCNVIGTAQMMQPHHTGDFSQAIVFRIEPFAISQRILVFDFVPVEGPVECIGIAVSKIRCSGPTFLELEFLMAANGVMVNFGDAVQFAIVRNGV